MPCKHVDPEVAVIHNGQVVYHLYDGPEDRYTFQFTTSPDEEPEPELCFDVRDIDVAGELLWAKVRQSRGFMSPDLIKEVIVHGIESGQITFPRPELALLMRTVEVLVAYTDESWGAIPVDVPAMLSQGAGQTYALAQVAKWHSDHWKEEEGIVLMEVLTWWSDEMMLGLNPHWVEVLGDDHDAETV